MHSATPPAGHASAFGKKAWGCIHTLCHGQVNARHRVRLIRPDRMRQLVMYAAGTSVLLVILASFRMIHQQQQQQQSQGAGSAYLGVNYPSYPPRGAHGCIPLARRARGLDAEIPFIGTRGSTEYRRSLSAMQAACRNASAMVGGESSPFRIRQHLIIHPIEEPDEYGDPSNFSTAYEISRNLMTMGIFPSDRSAKLRSSSGGLAVNIGARDGMGEDGNTDPTWPLFSNLEFYGVAIEASEAYRGVLTKNLQFLDAKPVIATVTPANVGEILLQAGIAPGAWIDVLKVDIDGWDCELIPSILANAYRIRVIIAEVNLKYPPPIKVALATCPRGAYRSCARHHVYGCSLQYMNDEIMRPAGFVLAQLDWQNAMYVDPVVARALKVPDGGVPLWAAYAEGYARRAHRERNMPWNRDIDHLLSHVPGDPSRTVEDVVGWMHDGFHKQDGSVVVGCGGESYRVDYARSPSYVPQTDRGAIAEGC